MASAHLFAYGTLMRGFRLHALLDGRRFLGPGRITARLFDLGAYPAIVADPIGVVWGEVYEVDDAALWRALDSAEGPQYHRHEVAVRITGGREVTAFAYWYLGPMDRAVPIPNGDYRSHAPARSIHRHPGV